MAKISREPRLGPARLKRFAGSSAPGRARGKRANFHGRRGCPDRSWSQKTPHPPWLTLTVPAAKGARTEEVVYGPKQRWALDADIDRGTRADCEGT